MSTQRPTHSPRTLLVGSALATALTVCAAFTGCKGGDAGEPPAAPAADAPAEPPAAPTASEPPAEAPAEPAPEREPEPAPEPEPLTAPDGTRIEPCGDPPPGMSCVPGGPFIRGDDDDEKAENARPKATIWVQTYYMDQNEVTFAEYKACEKARQCDRAGPQYLDFSRPEQPINGISWFDADKYCKAQGKRLPSEAQWEKAARGPDGELYPWGNEPPTCELAIIKTPELGRGCGLKKAGKKPETGRVWPVGSRPAYRYGLFDMAGNSYEWVADWYTRSYEQCGEDCQGFDPKGPCGGGGEACPGVRHKVVRGGSWYWDASRNLGYHRRPHVPNNNPFHHFGFRCAATLAEGQALAQRPAPTADAG